MFVVGLLFFGGSCKLNCRWCSFVGVVVVLVGLRFLVGWNFVLIVEMWERIVMLFVVMVMVFMELLGIVGVLVLKYVVLECELRMRLFVDVFRWVYWNGLKNLCVFLFCFGCEVYSF